MARLKRDNLLASREARNDLRARPEPYWRKLQDGLALGYRKSRDGGAWLARLYVGNKRYAEKRLATADDNADPDGLKVLSFAQAQRAAFDADRVQSEHGAGLTYTVGDALSDYVDYLRSDRKSADDAEAKLKAYVSDELREKRLADLFAADLDTWRDAALKRQRKARKVRKANAKSQKRTKVAPARPSEDELRERARRRKSTVNRVINLLKGALNRAYANGHASSKEPWTRLRRFKNADGSRTRWLTVEESMRLLNASSAQLRPLLRAAIQTGCRQGELLRVQGRDYDARSRTLRVAESKGGKPRNVPLEAEAAAMFEVLAAGRERQPLFERADGIAWHRVEIGRELARAVAGAGISPVTFHELRHTYASHLIQKGVGLLYVAQALGHRDSRMVERHYGHLAPSHFAETIRANIPMLGHEPSHKLANMAANRGRKAVR